MFIDVPKGKTPEEIYDWCVELSEKINREGLITINTTEKEDEK